MEVLLLPLGAEWYALPVQHVREVVLLEGPAAIEPLPGAPPTVLGLTNLRGDVVAVLDTAALLGIAAEPADHLVVVEIERGACALTARGRPRTGTLDAQAGPAELEPAIGRFAAGEDAVTLLDLETLLAPARIGAAA